MADAPSPKIPPVKKSIVKQATQPIMKTAAAPTPTSAPPPSAFFKTAWKKLDDWNVGLSGKVLIILMIVGLFSEIYHKL